MKESQFIIISGSLSILEFLLKELQTDVAVLCLIGFREASKQQKSL